MTAPVYSRPLQRTSWTHLASGLFLAAWLAAGSASTLATATPAVVKTAVLGLWLFIAALRSPQIIATLLFRAWPLVVMMLITGIYLAEVENGRQYFQGFFYTFIAFAMFCFYVQPQLSRERKILILAIGADLIATGIRTLIALQSDPLLSRYLATTESRRREVYGDQSFAGLGGYPFAYSLAAVLLLLLHFGLRSRAWRAPLLGIYVCGFALQFQLAFATAIVLVAAFSALMTVHHLVRRTDHRMFAYAATFIGWPTGLYAWALSALADQAWVTSEVSIRLREASQFVEGTSVTGSDLGMRFDFWEQSLHSLGANGLLGVAGRGQAAEPAGNHSAWLDLLANYGLLSLFLFLFIWFAWRETRQRVPEQSLSWVWSYFIVVGVINSIIFSTSVLTWFFLVPSLTLLLTSLTSTSSPTGVARTRTAIRGNIRPRADVSS